MSDQVGGTHYDKKCDPWDFIDANNLDFYEGNIVKYVARHRKKNGKEDLESDVCVLRGIG